MSELRPYSDSNSTTSDGTRVWADGGSDTSKLLWGNALGIIVGALVLLLAVTVLGGAGEDGRDRQTPRP